MSEVGFRCAAALGASALIFLGLGALRARGLLPSDPYGVLMTVCAAFAVLQWVVSILILLVIRRGLGEVICTVTKAQAGRDQSPCSCGRSQK